MKNTSTDQPSLAVHDLALLFPAMSAEEQDELTADIKAHGQLDDIVLDETGQIIDGRHRYAACRALGIVPRTITITDDELERQHGGLAGFILSRNIFRRHLDTGQRASIASKLAQLRSGQKKTAGAAARGIPLTQSEAAKRCNVGVDAVKQFRKVEEHGTPELTAAVEAGEIKVSTAAALVDLPPEQQTALAKDPPAARKAAATKRAEKKTGKPVPPAAKKTTPKTATKPAKDDRPSKAKSTAPLAPQHAKVVAKMAALLATVPFKEQTWTDIQDDVWHAAKALLKAQRDR